MLRKALCTLLLLAAAGVACDDADPPRPRDAGGDAKKDTGSDATRDTTADRTPDTTPPQPDGPVVDAPAVDAPPVDAPMADRPDAGIDAPRDTPVVVDAPVDMPVDAPPDSPPDMQPDTQPVDLAPDTEEPEPDAQEPDTSGLPAQPFVPMNGCTEEMDFEDHRTDNPAAFDWNIDQTDPICFKVQVGTEVHWSVRMGETFATHPVEQFPADATSPIMGKATADDDDYEVTFPAVGTFGFRCTIHHMDGTDMNMRGAIWVVP